MPSSPIRAADVSSLSSVAADTSTTTLSSTTSSFLSGAAGGFRHPIVEGVLRNIEATGTSDQTVRRIRRTMSRFWLFSKSVVESAENNDFPELRNVRANSCAELELYVQHLFNEWVESAVVGSTSTSTTADGNNNNAAAISRRDGSPAVVVVKNQTKLLYLQSFVRFMEAFVVYKEEDMACGSSGDADFSARRRKYASLLDTEDDHARRSKLLEAVKRRYAQQKQTLHCSDRKRLFQPTITDETRRCMKRSTASVVNERGDSGSSMSNPQQDAGDDATRRRNAMIGRTTYRDLFEHVYNCQQVRWRLFLSLSRLGVTVEWNGEANDITNYCGEKPSSSGDDDDEYQTDDLIYLRNYCVVNLVLLNGQRGEAAYKLLLCQWMSRVSDYIGRHTDDDYIAIPFYNNKVRDTTKMIGVNKRLEWLIRVYVSFTSPKAATAAAEADDAYLQRPLFHSRRPRDVATGRSMNMAGNMNRLAEALLKAADVQSEFQSACTFHSIRHVLSTQILHNNNGNITLETFSADRDEEDNKRSNFYEECLTRALGHSVKTNPKTYALKTVAIAFKKDLLAWRMLRALERQVIQHYGVTAVEEST